MRVILAIAERYQPRSVKPRSSSDPKSAAQQHVHHVTKEGSPDRSHMTKPGSPDNHMTNSGHDVSRLAANSVSVPNMAALPRERSLSQPSSQLLPGYGPPRHNSYAGLSQPDRPYYERAERPYERINELAVKGLTNSLSQTDYGGNDTYCTPFDQLPPSAAPQIIAKGERHDVIRQFYYSISPKLHRGNFMSPHKISPMLHRGNFMSPHKISPMLHRGNFTSSHKISPVSHLCLLLLLQT